jgi:hypothetical protein
LINSSIVFLLNLDNSLLIYVPYGFVFSTVSMTVSKTVSVSTTVT